ncbi:hypothetical protein KT99_13089 [Shewanella benthica KT99]|uniref:Uncharacterized protein n=1 Tax=Shewanella benthica KT99 TaxID=314608 RepID=A9CZI2_9GAMM|nr:hypothetical protein KT99_13089 [Shewanella benthica KT99]
MTTPIDIPIMIPIDTLPDTALNEAPIDEASATPRPIAKVAERVKLHPKE